MRRAVLDLGSNSFHVLVADLDGTVTPVLRERELLHLGAAVARHGCVPDPERSRARATAGRLAELARRAGATEVLAVATSALRDAGNGAEVIAELRDAARTEVEVLSGAEEARLAYLGVRAAIADLDDPVLVLDLGGGSLELALGTGAESTWSTSLPLGASRLSALLTDDPAAADELETVRGRVDAELDAVTDHLDECAPSTVVAIGGTVRALARVVAQQRVPSPDTVHELQLTSTELVAIRDRLATLDRDGRAAVPGIGPGRAVNVHVAALVLVRTLERLGVDAFLVSDWGLREGLLLDRRRP